MSSEQKLTVRFYPTDQQHRQALEILQVRAALYKKSYADTIAEAVVGYYAANRMSDDDLADRIATKVAELLGSQTPDMAPTEKSPEVPAPSGGNIDIDWSFLGG